MSEIYFETELDCLNCGEESLYEIGFSFTPKGLEPDETKQRCRRCKSNFKTKASLSFDVHSSDVSIYDVNPAPRKEDERIKRKEIK